MHMLTIIKLFNKKQFTQSHFVIWQDCHFQLIMLIDIGYVHKTAIAHLLISHCPGRYMHITGHISYVSITYLLF